MSIHNQTLAADISAALENSSVASAVKAYFAGFSGRVDSTAATNTYYLQILNASSLPADGAVTFVVHPEKVVHTNGTDSLVDIDLTGNHGMRYAGTGLVWCLSSTEFTKTIIAGAMVSGTLFYKV